MNQVEKLEEELVSREVFRRVFGSQDGQVVLALIRRECGVETMNPETVKPDLIAFCGWLHYKLGIYHPQNLVPVTKALLEAADDEDLYTAQKALQGQGGMDAD